MCDKNMELSNCDYCENVFPMLVFDYGADHIPPDYKICPVCGRELEVQNEHD